MIVAISGSRGYQDDRWLKTLEEAILLSRITKITGIVHGGNFESVDRLADRYARKVGIKPRVFDAEWEKTKSKGIPLKAAGIIRNGEMIKVSQALIALWDGSSPGTYDMIKRARKAQFPGIVFRLDNGVHELLPAQLSLGLDASPKGRR